MPRKLSERPEIGLLAKNGESRKFISDYLSTTPLGIPDIEEDAFSTIMDSFVKAMLAAWSDGYLNRSKE